MKKMIAVLMLALAAVPIAHALETGSANQVLRVPAAGGSPKYGKVNLASPAAVVSPLPTLNGGLGLDASASTGVPLLASGTTTVTATTGTGNIARIGDPTFTGTVTTPALIVSGATASRAAYLDGSKSVSSATTTLTQLNYLGSATGTTGTTSTNLVFSTSPSITTPTFVGLSSFPNSSAISSTGYFTLAGVGGANTSHTISGASITDGATFTGDYGQLMFSASSGFTGSARKYMLTNAFGGVDFAIIMGGTSQAAPTLGTNGVVSAGTRALSINSATGGNVEIKGSDGTASATAGYVGEWLIANGGDSAAGAGEASNLVPTADGDPRNIASLLLTPGDYTCSANLVYTFAGTWAGTGIFANITTTSKGGSITALGGYVKQTNGAGYSVAANEGMAVGARRVLVTANTVLYLVGYFRYTTLGTGTTWTSNTTLACRRER